MVIINADDFGMNESCSRAIARAFFEGLITDTTMMATGEYFDKAVLLAKERGFSDRIGIHFNLTEGTPLTQGVCSVQAFVRDGRFCKRYEWNHDLTEEQAQAVYDELCAQVEKLKKAGIGITHADSHHYLHNAPYLAPIFVKVCREFGIKKIRLQRNLGAGERSSDRNAYYREQGFRMTKYFARLRDLEHIAVPDDTEILVHPDFDKNGRLIDRRGTADGHPIGAPLSDLKKQGFSDLGSYNIL